MRVKYKNSKEDFIGTIIEVKTITKSTITTYTEGELFEDYIKLIGNSIVTQNICIDYIIKCLQILTQHINSTGRISSDLVNL